MERENLEFRTFLKCNADEEILDEQFVKLHNELFAEYDCSRGRNCCKCYYGSIPLSDIKKDASHLNMSSDEFVELYLSEKDSEGNYRTKHKLCDFLQEDGSCVLGNCKPDNCKNIHIQIGQNVYIVYIVCWRPFRFVRLRLKYLKD